MQLVGLKVRKVTQGQAIACGLYPWKPVFLVLEGRVSVRLRHSKKKKKTRTQHSIRHATRMMGKSLLANAREYLNKVFCRKSRPTQADRLPNTNLIPGGVFGITTPTLACAHAVSKSCWILDVDPINPSGLAIVNQLVAREIPKLKY